MEQILQNYATLIVRRGATVRPGKPVVIQVDTSESAFACMLAAEAYRAGASHVEILWSDEQLEYLQYSYETLDQLTSIPACKVEHLLHYLRQDASYIRLVSQNPFNLEKVEADKRSAGLQASQQAFQEKQDLVMNHTIPWCIAAVPGAAWAKLVYPEEAQPVEALWRCIAACCYCDQAPLLRWDKHIRRMKHRLEKLNSMDLDRLWFVSENGTNLTIGLCEHHQWNGGDSVTPNGVRFSPNLPTEELYTVPHKDRTNGIVVSTRPLSVSGTVLKAGFQLIYRNGCVTEVLAKDQHDQAILENIFQNDPGARRLGEVALVDYDNPIGKSKRMFYSTLFDENAACHLAMGNGIRAALKTSPDEDTQTCGLNQAKIHLDFMIGTRDMKCIGISKSHKNYLLMEHGNILI